VWIISTYIVLSCVECGILIHCLLSKVKSKLGNTCANFFTQGKFTRVVPMSAGSDASKSLIDFTDDVGIPESIVMDGAGEFTGNNTEFVKECCQMHIRCHTMEQGRSNQNHPAEHEIGNLAKRWKLQMTKKDIPKHVWDFGLVYESEIMSRMSCGRDKRTRYEEVTGETPDIREWTDFELWDLVWYWD